jgi:uncharacterized membrane protein (DUF4010 family)
MPEDYQTFLQLGVALAIGLLIGTERGWHERKAADGSRVAGVRTYALIGLLGGVSGLLTVRFGGLVLGLIFVALAGVLTVAHILAQEEERDVGITGLIAALVTFALGAMAALGELAVSGSLAVVTTLLLGYKRLIHRWVGSLEKRDLTAGLTLLLLSVVLLPLLPNRGYGPWQALNPYEIWWMVILIASISFAGYYAIKLVGEQRGILFTGLFGGLASSTALTMNFARLARDQSTLTPVLASAILLACGTMFPRMLLVAGLVNPDLLQRLIWPAAAMAVITYAPAAWYWRSGSHAGGETDPPLRNPLELKAALTFGALLALVMLLARGLKSWLGEPGMLLLAAVSGITDVDAINLTLSRMSQDELPLALAASAIVVAAAVNSLVKGLIAATIGGWRLGLRVAAPLLGAATAGIALAL